MIKGWSELRKRPCSLQVGDILMQRSTSDISRLIREATRQGKETPSFPSHAAMVVEAPLRAKGLSALKVDVSIIEATTPRTRVCPIWEYATESSDSVIFRMKGLSAKKRTDLQIAAQSYVGQRYPIPKLILGGLDHWIMGDRYFFRRAANLFPTLYCDDTVESIYADADLPIATMQFGQGGPDELMDYMVRNPDRFEVVFVSGDNALAALKESYPNYEVLA